MPIPEQAVSTVWGYMGKDGTFKVLIAKYVVDTDKPYPTEGPPPEERGKWLQFLAHHPEEVGGKCRFYCFSDDELAELKRKLEAEGVSYTIREIKIPPAIIDEIEKMTPKPSTDDVRRILRERGF